MGFTIMFFSDVNPFLLLQVMSRQGGEDLWHPVYF
jgi:hypothetical protein